MEASNHLVVSNLTVSFPGLSSPVIDLHHLEVPAGKSLSITGPSGSGKTTFMNMLSGLSKPPPGSVLWGKNDLGTLGEAYRDRWRTTNVGIIMQEFHLFPGLSALDNVLLPSGFRNFRIDSTLARRAENLLRRVGLADFRRDVGVMSRGEMQRVAVARALLSQPPIIIADEPTASLDSGNAALIGQLLLDISQQDDLTLIVATHDPSLAQKMSLHLELVPA